MGGDGRDTQSTQDKESKKMETKERPRGRAVFEDQPQTRRPAPGREMVVGRPVEPIDNRQPTRHRRPGTTKGGRP